MSSHARTRVSAQAPVSTQALVSAAALPASGNTALGDETRGEQGFERDLALMTLAAGDEKHDPSAHSIRDIVWVLYDRILQFDPLAPRMEDRDRFILSKGQGPTTR